MKKLLFFVLAVFVVSSANAVSLCDSGSAEACAKVMEDFFLETYAEQHQTKDSPLSQREFVMRLKDAVGSDQFQNLYRTCTNSTENKSKAVSCIVDGFTPLLTRKIGNSEAKQFVQVTLPSIVSSWDEDIFRQNVVSFFPINMYSEVPKTANLLFGKCKVDRIEEKGRKFEMTYGLVLYHYTVGLTCEKIKHPNAEVFVGNENGTWKYGRLDVNKKVEIDLRQKK